ncbi:uncharacterized protein EAE97_002099 [Botrytis byssoidea]|uniref:Sushi domain-containing protein n=1 Tax=Botrytis byssoidea TaxID=139641 RepID=A0A9P5IYY5_9HELO|nr:uncharacterized protein EAE97_002099 [Botrytis byssoidea]KAF7952602.1 hypothetical protein EAE97_002099 [Botrytis byssoidea]
MHSLSIFIFGFTAVRTVFGTPIPRLPTSSGNITAYSNNVHIESHLSKRSSGSNEIVECPEGFAPRDGTKIVTCVSIHLKLEMHD